MCLVTISTPRWRGLLGDLTWTLVKWLGTVMVLDVRVLMSVWDGGALFTLVATTWFICRTDLRRLCRVRLVRTVIACWAILVAMKGPLL